MPFSWSVLAAIGAMVCWGFGDFFIQKNTRRVGDIEALAFIGIIGSIGLLPFVWNEIPLMFTQENAALLTALGVLTFIAAVVLFESYKISKLAVVDVILEIELPITILLGIIFFGETLSLMQWFLVAAIFVGIVLVSTNSLSRFSSLSSLERGVLLAAVGSIGMAVMNFWTAAASRNISPLMSIWVPWVVFTILCLAVIWKREGFSKMWGNAVKFKELVLLMGFFDTIAWVLYATALHDNPLSITTAITESYPVISVALAITFNKERIAKHQWVGAALAIGCTALLALML